VINHCLPQECHKINCLDSVYRRDNFTYYEDAFGANNNPIRSYKDGTFESPSRGAGYYNILSMDNTGIPAEGEAQRVVKVRFTEAVLCPPFCFDEVDEQPALFGINRLNLNVTWSPKMESMLWSRIERDGDVTATISQVLVKSPKLLLERIQPQPGFTIPKQLQYDHFLMKVIKTDFGSIAAGATQTLSKEAVTLGATIPSRIFVFARRDPTKLSPLEANTFLQIKGVSVSMNSSNTLLNDATPQQLWDMSRMNGLHQEYEEWTGRKIGDGALSGGMILIDPARDLALQLGETNGTPGQS